MSPRDTRETPERLMKRLVALAFAMLPAFGWATPNSYINYAPGTAPSFEGLWWKASESGWGISISHQGDILFAVWYTYDTDGSPMWLVMPDAALVDMNDGDMMGMTEMSMMGMVANPPTFTGTLYRTTGPAFSSATFDRNAVGVEAVGMGTFQFRGVDNGVFAYTVGDHSGAKEITRQVFAAALPKCSVGGVQKASGPANYQDLWWQPSESGWGVNIAHQGDTLFATWFTYDAGGKGLWLVMSNVAKVGEGRYSGKIYRASGPSFNGASWDAAGVRAAEVGSATFTFGDPSHGRFEYTVNGVAQSKPIERMVYSLPASVCN
jgi:hypothetical protein